MKTINDLSNMLDKWANKIDERAEKGLEKTAQQVYQDIIQLAPGNGPYKQSIEIYPIEKQNDKMSVFIGSDLMVGPTIHGPSEEPGNSGKGMSKNAPAGTKYNLGYLLEHGTYEHAIPNAFGLGNYWSFTSKNGEFHKGTLESDFHPGTLAQPHYSLAIEKNKKLFRDNIIKEVTWR